MYAVNINNVCIAFIIKCTPVYLPKLKSWNSDQKIKLYFVLVASDVWIERPEHDDPDVHPGPQPGPEVSQD